MPGINDPVHLKPFSIRQYDLWIGLSALGAVYAFVGWLLSIGTNMSWLWSLILIPTLFVLPFVGGFGFWLFLQLRYQYKRNNYESSDPRATLFMVLKTTIEKYSELERQFGCLSWIVAQGLVECPCPQQDLENFKFFHGVLTGYRDYLTDTLNDDGWLGEFVSDDDSRFAPLIPRLLEVQTGLDRWRDHYATLMAQAVDLPDDAPEDCR
ncbi:MAG: hypothetical protein ABH846_04485 [Patescibacteria group bacterium]